MTSSIRALPRSAPIPPVLEYSEIPSVDREMYAVHLSLSGRSSQPV